VCVSINQNQLASLAGCVLRNRLGRKNLGAADLDLERNRTTHHHSQLHTVCLVPRMESRGFRALLMSFIHMVSRLGIRRPVAGLRSIRIIVPAAVDARESNP
jgi:hypothetical protein